MQITSFFSPTSEIRTTSMCVCVCLCVCVRIALQQTKCKHANNSRVETVKYLINKNYSTLTLIVLMSRIG